MVANRDASPKPIAPARRALLLASAVAIATTCSACSTLRPAWKHKAKADAGPHASAQGPAEEVAPPPVTAAPQGGNSIAYPYANGSALPTAAASAPNPTLRR